MSLPSYQEHISFGRYAQLSAVENRSLEVCMATRACWSMSKQSQQRCGWQFCLVGCALPFQLGHFVHKNVVNQRTGPLGELVSGVSKVPNFRCLWDVGFSGDGAWCQAFAPISHGCWPEGSSSTESSYPGRNPGNTLLVLSWCCCCCWLWQVSVQE